MTKIPLEPPPKVIKEKARYTLNHYLSLHLWEKSKELEEVAEKAAKEYQNERVLDKIEKEWEPMVFQLSAWRD